MGLLNRLFRRSGTGIRHDEVVVFYPSFGHLSPDGATWALHIQGCVFDPTLNWLRRNTLLRLIQRALKIDALTGVELFRERMGQFLVEITHHRAIAVRFGEQVYPVGESGPAGLFRGIVQLPREEVQRLLDGDDIEGRWLPFAAVTVEQDTRDFAGQVQLIGPRGWSVMSDVDDTIKYSNVPNRRELVRNTFAREFKAVPGMAALYRFCAERGAVFHYVSGSPWQLYDPLSEFWQEEGFPLGSFHLKTFRWRDTLRTAKGKSPQHLYKRASIDPILAAFPQRRFVLFGDSGEEDPEIYGELARLHPELVAQVFIRNVGNEPPDSPRLARAFEGVDPIRWRAFRDPAEIEPRVEELVEQLDSPMHGADSQIEHPRTEANV